METACILYGIWHYGWSLQRTLWEASLLSAFLLLCDFSKTVTFFQVPYSSLSARTLQKWRQWCLKMKGLKILYHKQVGDFNFAISKGTKRAAWKAVKTWTEILLFLLFPGHFIKMLSVWTSAAKSWLSIKIRSWTINTPRSQSHRKLEREGKSESI